MTITAQISFVRKRKHKDPGRRIVAVGGMNPAGDDWSLEQQDAINAIELGHCEFFVVRGEQPLKVIVADAENGKYLKTEADERRPDRLLELPEAPAQVE
ncbi:MAG TPA: DUF3892 domain-containing protein [Gammaproteobacteria bacterium]|nr:DUF3892 domain-containing protein [Gammaproteobacteria bacterium]